jgi:outer membrane protein assembly factor BamB
MNYPALLSSLVLASGLTVHAADWPSWRGPDRNGISKEADWNSAWDAAGPAKAWTANVGIGFSSMVVSEGRLYTAGWADEQDTVRCLDAATGQLLWSHAYKEKLGNKMYEGGPNATPLVVGDRVFISSGDDGGELLKVSGKRVDRVWKNKNLSTFTGTAVLIDGMLYGHETAGYKGANQELRCVDLETGEVKWGEKGFGQGSIIAAGDRLIVLSDKGELSVVRANPGKFELLARSQVIGGKCWTSPVLAQGRLYVRNAKGDLVCLDVRPKA